MQMRIQDNQRITANYLGTVVTGTVESSRVKYGGDLQYTVNLDKPVQFRWRDTPSTRVLINQKEVIQNV
jgi:hypothetical protein